MRCESRPSTQHSSAATAHESVMTTVHEPLLLSPARAAWLMMCDRTCSQAYERRRGGESVMTKTTVDCLYLNIWLFLIGVNREDGYAYTIGNAGRPVTELPPLPHTEVPPLTMALPASSKVWTSGASCPAALCASATRRAVSCAGW